MRSVKDKPFYCQSSVGTIPFQGRVFLLLAFCKQNASLQQLLSHMATVIMMMIGEGEKAASEASRQGWLRKVCLICRVAGGGKGVPGSCVRECVLRAVRAIASKRFVFRMSGVCVLGRLELQQRLQQRKRSSPLPSSSLLEAASSHLCLRLPNVNRSTLNKVVRLGSRQ